MEGGEKGVLREGEGEKEGGRKGGGGRPIWLSTIVIRPS